MHVRGQAADAVAQVELVLMRDERQLSRQTVHPRRGRFVGVFTLGRPRVAGAIIVMAIGRDRHGIPVATVRREFAVAALLAAAGEPRPMLGEDGIFGSRGVDLSAFLERVPGRPVARPDLRAWPVGDLGWQVNPTQL